MKPFIFFTLLLLSLSVSAYVRIHEELYIPGRNPMVVKELIDSGSVEIDHVTSAGFELYGPKGISSYLDSKNIVYLNMKEINQKNISDYPSSEEIAKKMRELSASYPKIMKLFKIGKSVKGKDLLVIKISDNADQDEVEPEFKYISSMHGDEITGRELTIRLIEEIGQKYGTDSEITELVDNTEIFIMPSMNPDGSDLRQRANAKFIDLNRNFPDIIRDTNSGIEGRQIETQHVMNFQASRKFSLSANFHGGTIVANYPWDSKYDLHPLDSLVKEFSRGYADLNPEMRASSEFPGGIINGAQWYIVRGGMQDWSYNWYDDLQITIELSHQKWPNFSEIPGFYKDNRDSMIQYMKYVHQGAGFKVLSSNVSGKVEITQTSPGIKKIGIFNFKASEFYKVLPEGEYTFTILRNNKKKKKLSFKVNSNLIPTNGNYLEID